MSGSAVDTHVHLWETIATATPPGPPPDLVAGLPAALAAMGEAGIARAVLVQPSHLGLDHRYLLDAASGQFPRFKVVLLGIPSSLPALDTLTVLSADPSVVGLRLVPLRSPERDWFGAGADGLWQLARERRLTVFVLASPTQLRALLPALDRFGDVPVVIDHLGRPDLGPAETWDSVINELAARPNVLLKISALGGITTGPFPFRESWDWVRLAVQRVGTTRLIWGSDFPYLGRTGSLAEARSAGSLCLAAADLTATEMDAVLWQNATARFWEADARGYEGQA